MNSIEAQKKLSARELIIFNPELDCKGKSTATAYILYFFLGPIGRHKFYIGNPSMGFFYIVLVSVGFLLMLGGFTSAFDPSTTADDASAVLSLFCHSEERKSEHLP